MPLRTLPGVLCCSLSLLLSLHPAWAQTSTSAAAAKPATAATPAAAIQPAYAADPRFGAALAEAREMNKRHQFAFAADAYKKANKIAGGTCADCVRGLYLAQMNERSFKDAANTASLLEGLVSGPRNKSTAVYLRADAVYLAAGDKPKPDKLEAAHSLLVEAIGLDPKNPAALYLDGKVLAQLGKIEEAKADFAQCVSCVDPKDPSRLRAEHFAENPELALHKMAPAFEVTSLDGSRFNLDAMGGQVVLIDFWATWCGPCNEELPHMRQIAKEFAGLPLVIISVSWDADEEKWKSFIAKNGMTWVQYRDADHKLSEQFGVESIPHYFTIDSDGVLTAEMLGSGSDVEGKLKKLLARANAAKKEMAVAPAAVVAGPGN